MQIYMDNERMNKTIIAITLKLNNDPDYPSVSLRPNVDFLFK